MSSGPFDRFFPRYSHGQVPAPDGVPEWGPWDSSRPHWWPEDHVDLILPRDKGADQGRPREKGVDSREPGGCGEAAVGNGT